MLTVALKAQRISGRDFEDVIMDLVLLSERDFREFADLRPALRSVSTVRDLNRHCHALLARAPHEALLLAELAVRVAGALRPGENDTGSMNHALGDAWQHRAAALIEAGDVSEATRAVAKAEQFYASCDVIRPEGSPSLALIKARIVYEQGHPDEALRIADEAASLFLTIHDDPARHVNARIFCANVLYMEEQYSDAIVAYDKAAEIAKELEDSSSLAYIATMMGNVLAAIGDHEGASEQFDAAIEVFTQLNNAVEVARVRCGMGISMMRRGEFDEAITAFEQSREQLLRLGMPIVAAQVALRIVDAMLLAGRHTWVEPLCGGMIETFTRANLHREAQKALGYLDELARAKRGILSAGEVGFVRDFLERLERQPSLRFTTPEP